MKFPLSWLKEYVDTQLTPAQIAKTLTLTGIEVDSFEKTQLGFSKVVVAKVLETQQHPNADKLTVATVTDGTETFQVVCGAPNCRPGIKTALALVGASLKDEEGKEFKIKKSKLRGVESCGMLCAADELGLPKQGDGILEFADHLKEGADLADLYADTTFEVSLTPNLGHCLNIVGIARELAAATKQKVKLPQVQVQESGTKNNVTVQVEDPTNCPRYACRLIRNVKVGPSPDWLQTRLTACGIRPINNVVDATNYVLMELGHPLHAFDYDKLEGGKIVVRAAKQDETFITLDGKERKLSPENLVICDQNKPIALAGVMGGQNTEVSDQTTNVLLESAMFRPGSIRRTSKEFILFTDASHRFERGTDPNAIPVALDRAAQLIHEIAGGEIAPGIVDVKEKDFAPTILPCRLSRINQILGTHLSVGEVETIFNNLDLHTHWDGQDTFQVTVPTYRNDIQAEIDLIEEAARGYGYDNIPRRKSLFTSSVLPHNPVFLFEREVRSRLISESLQECITCDLVGPTILDVVQDHSMPPEAVVKVMNPVSVEQSILRTSLLPGLLQMVKHNFDHQNQNIAAFEIGRIHFKKEDQYKEQSVVGIILTGKSRPHHWERKPQDVDFYDLKGITESLCRALDIPYPHFDQNTLKTFHPGRQAAIMVDALEVGSIGEIHPAIQRRLDVPQRLYFAEINLHDLMQVRKRSAKFQEASKYPSSDRDWTITLKDSVPIQNVFATIRTIPSKLLADLSLIDIYTSDKLGKDKKNVTFHFVYRDKNRTVSLEEVDAEHKRITETATQLLQSAIC